MYFYARDSMQVIDYQYISWKLYKNLPYDITLFPKGGTIVKIVRIFQEISNTFERFSNSALYYELFVRKH